MNLQNETSCHYPNKANITNIINGDNQVKYILIFDLLPNNLLPTILQYAYLRRSTTFLCSSHSLYCRIWARKGFWDQRVCPCSAPSLICFRASLIYFLGAQ